MSTLITIYRFSTPSGFHCMMKSIIFKGNFHQRQEALDGHVERNQLVVMEKQKFQNLEESIMQAILAFLNNQNSKAEGEFIVFIPKQVHGKNCSIAILVENSSVVLEKHQFEHREQSEGIALWHSRTFTILTQRTKSTFQKSITMPKTKNSGWRL